MYELRQEQSLRQRWEMQRWLLGAGGVSLVILLGVIIYRWSPSKCLASATPTQPCWGLIGNDGTHLAEERRAGIGVKLFSVSWRSYMSAPYTVNATYRSAKQTELAELRRAGFDVILSMGIHDTPGWLHTSIPDSYYVNQYGERYDAGPDSGDANLVWSPAVRDAASHYITTLFADLGTQWGAVRIGGGRYGELTYPPAEYNGRTNCYWAWSDGAAAQSPLPAWRPGTAASTAEVQRWLDWYLGALTDYANWQVTTVRAHYKGPIMVLFPSWGIRPGDIDAAIAVDLDGTTSAERNGEIQRGFDFARQIAALSDPNLIITSTWLDADASGDQTTDQRRWSPIKYLASLAAVHQQRPPLFGENTGHGQRAEMDLSAAQMRRYQLLGMLWFREDELFSGAYATLDDYAAVIRGE